MYAAPCLNANGPDRLRFTPTATTFIAVTAVLNALLYHLPLFSFAAANFDPVYRHRGSNAGHVANCPAVRRAFSYSPYPPSSLFGC